MIYFLPKGSTVIAILCVWACLFATYLLFAGQLSADEAVAGAVCAAAAVLWWVRARRASARAFAFDVGSWAAAGRACRKLPGTTLTVAGVLLRALVHRETGQVTHWLFAHGQRADPFDSGRRAVVVLAASIAPDGFVVRTPMERGEIVVHTFPSGETSRDPRWPV